MGNKTGIFTTNRRVVFVEGELWMGNKTGIFTTSTYDHAANDELWMGNKTGIFTTGVACGVCGFSCEWVTKQVSLQQ